MPGSDTGWHKRRIAAFLALGLGLYAGLFLWSDRLLPRHGQENPFLRIQTAPDSVDWIILGASHAMPLGFADMPEVIRNRTGQRLAVLAVTGGGPFVMRVIAERWFADHRARGVLIVLDDFGFGDTRWNAARLGDAGFLAKIPADLTTALVLARAVPRGLAWQSWLAQASGFARINDRNRLMPDSWEAEARFDSAPRPSTVALRARIALLYPGPPDPVAQDQGLADLAALIRLAQASGAFVVILRPPLPQTFRAALPPPLPGLEDRLAELAALLGVPVVDHSQALPGARNYLDSDHLNRQGVMAWLDLGLARLLANGKRALP